MSAHHSYSPSAMSDCRFSILAEGVTMLHSGVAAKRQKEVKLSCWRERRRVTDATFPCLGTLEHCVLCERVSDGGRVVKSLFVLGKSVIHRV
jgi:hypothetical protein